MKKHAKFIWGFIAGTLLAGVSVPLFKNLLGKL